MHLEFESRGREYDGAETYFFRHESNKVVHSKIERTIFIMNKE